MMRAEMPEDRIPLRVNVPAGFQGNRNPFIDKPGLADRIGEEALRRAGRWGLGYGLH